MRFDLGTIVLEIVRRAFIPVDRAAPSQPPLALRSCASSMCAQARAVFRGSANYRSTAGIRRELQVTRYLRRTALPRRRAVQRLCALIVRAPVPSPLVPAAFHCMADAVGSLRDRLRNQREAETADLASLDRRLQFRLRLLDPGERIVWRRRTVVDLFRPGRPGGERQAHRCMSCAASTVPCGAREQILDDGPQARDVARRDRFAGTDVFDESGGEQQRRPARPRQT